MFNKFRSFFYVDLFIEDFKIIYEFFKKLNFLHWLFIFLILPFMWFFFLIFIFSVFLHIINYFFIFLLRFFNVYFFKSPQNNIIYEYPKDSNLNLFFLIIFICFYNLPKKISFLWFYNFGKNLQNKPKLGGFLEILRFLIPFLFFNLIRLFFFFVTSYNIKVFKFSIQFLEIIFKNWKHKLNNKYINLKIFLEQSVIDFINLYDFYLNLKIENKRIKFCDNGVIFNPPRHLTKQTLNIIKEKTQISPENLEKLQTHIRFIVNNSQLTTSALRTYNESDYYDNKNLDSDLENYIGEKICHTSLEFPINEDISIMIRETTKSKVLIKEVVNDINFIDDFEIKNSYMKTSLQNPGSINKDVQSYKTSIIQANNTDIIRVNNEKLLKNIYTGKTNKTDFVTKMLSSILEPVYSYEKGNIFKDPKYKNLHDKLLNDPNYSEVRNEYLNHLHGLVQIWSDHFSIFHDLQNSEIIEQVAKFIILDTQYAINPKFLEEILNS